MVPDGMGVLHSNVDEPYKRGFLKGKWLDGIGRILSDNEI